MKTEELLAALIPALFLVLLFVESRYRARTYGTMPRWPLIGGLFFVLTLVIGALTPLLLPVDILSRFAVLDLSSLGLLGIPVGVLTVTFFGYWLHRAEHQFGWLWRATHQLHHSAVSVDLLGAFYAHPLEVAIKVSLGTVVGTFLLGLSPTAAAVVGLTTATLSMFQHLNIRTPRSLGYFLQRPESHALHHERGIYARNFGDLPLWDILFGTFANPSQFHGAVGFELASSQRISDMLLMRDVNR